jgi:hypothetical protein
VHSLQKQEQDWDGAEGPLAHHKLLGSSERTEEVEGVYIDGGDVWPELETMTSICRLWTSRAAGSSVLEGREEGGASGGVGDKEGGRNQWIRR